MIRIHKWSETFETAKTRKLVHLSWLHCPAGVDSSGYIELMTRGADGIQAFGVFLAICQWSATCPPLIRGSLARSDGKPLQTRQIASILRIPVSVAETAIAILCDESVGWLVSDDTQNTNEKPQSATHPPLVSQSSANDLPLIPVQGEERSGENIEEETASAVRTPAKAKTPTPRFEAPAIADVQHYAEGAGITIDAERFVDHYTSNGWRVGGRTAMKDWRAAVRNWAKNNITTGSQSNGKYIQRPTRAQSHEAANADAFAVCQAAVDAASNEELPF